MDIFDVFYSCENENMNLHHSFWPNILNKLTKWFPKIFEISKYLFRFWNCRAKNGCCRILKCSQVFFCNKQFGLVLLRFFPKLNSNLINFLIENCSNLLVASTSLVNIRSNWENIQMRLRIQMVLRFEFIHTSNVHRSHRVDDQTFLIKYANVSFEWNFYAWNPYGCLIAFIQISN